MNVGPRLGVLAYALGSLGRRRAKAVAVGGGLAFAVALVAAVLFLTDALRGEADRARLAMPDLTVQRLVAGRPSTIGAAVAAKIADIPSVKRVRPRVWGYLFLPSLQGNVTVIGVPPGAPPLDAAKGVIAAGRDLRPGAHEMVAGAALARFLGLVLGDVQGMPSPNPEARPLTLVGTFDSSVELYAADVVLCDEADARAILNVPPDEATDLAIEIANPAEARVVARTVLGRVPDARVIDRELLGRVYALAFGRRAGLVLAATLPAILALLALAWDRVSGLGAEERREVATLKAVGWSTRDVLAARFCESLAVALAATASGLALAYVWVFVLGAPGLRATIAGWTVLYPEAPLTPMVDLAQIAGVTLAVTAPFVGLSVIPAWRAAVADPVEVMRGGG